jgi:hypothetical protein
MASLPRVAPRSRTRQPHDAASSRSWTAAIGPRLTSPWVIAGVAALVGVWAMLLYMRAGLLLLQGDSVAHLDIARGVFDSLTPSFAQLGGVWLPLPHLLMLPSIWIDPLWRSGLAGSVPAIVAFALAAVYAQKIVALLTGSRAAGLAGAALLITNPNLLFMQATPMTETLTVFLVLASTYHLLRFVRDQSFLHLLLNAAFVGAATLTRYETWFLIPATGGVVLYSTWRQRRGRGYVEAALVLWGVLATYGVVLWLLYNGLIFGDILNFEHGVGSDLSSARAALSIGQLPTKGHVLISIVTYGWATIDNLGVPLVVVAVAGLGVLWLSRLSLGEKLAVMVPLSIFAFSVLSLERGESLIYTPHTTPASFYNERYGLLMLPFALVTGCMLAYRRRRLGPLILAGIVFLQLGSIGAVRQASSASVTAMDGVSSSTLATDWAARNIPVLGGAEPVVLYEAEMQQAQEGVTTARAARWLHDQTPRGTILISEQVNGRFVYDANLPLHHFVSEGTKPIFTEALADPFTYIDWIVYRPQDPRDLIRPMMEPLPPPGFNLVFDNGDYRIYERLGG